VFLTTCRSCSARSSAGGTRSPARATPTRHARPRRRAALDRGDRRPRLRAHRGTRARLAEPGRARLLRDRFRNPFVQHRDRRDDPRVPRALRRSPSSPTRCAMPSSPRPGNAARRRGRRPTSTLLPRTSAQSSAACTRVSCRMVGGRSGGVRASNSIVRRAVARYPRSRVRRHATPRPRGLLQLP
jgi:hypothetical protein